MFFEGYTSLLLDRRPSTNNQQFINSINHERGPGGQIFAGTNGYGYYGGVNTLSHSTDSQCKTIINSLKQKVIGHSSNEVDSNFKECNFNVRNDLSNNKSKLPLG